MVEWVLTWRPVFWWRMGRTLTKGEPLPGPSSSWWRQVPLAPCNKPCSFSGCVRMVIGAPPATLGVAAQAQMEAQTHISTTVRAGAGHGWQADRAEDIPKATTDGASPCQCLLRCLIPNIGTLTGRRGCRVRCSAWQSASHQSGTCRGNAQVWVQVQVQWRICLLYTSPSPRDGLLSRMPSSA